MTDSLPLNAAGAVSAVELTFESPGPGTWMLDTTHHGRRPVTRAMREIADEAFVVGMGRMLERYGLPLAGFRSSFVHGCQYVRPVAVGEPDVSKGDPPRPLLWLLARVHPELRRRNRIAAQAWAERRWRADVEEWYDRRRPRVVARNRGLQAIDPTSLDDAGLAAHINDIAAHLRVTATGSFELHGGDIIPVGDYLAHCGDWGIDPASAAQALVGASPATREVVELLQPVADGLASASTPPRSLDEVRALGPDVAEAIDTWMDTHGWRLLFSDDLDSPVLAECPELQLHVLLGAGRAPTAEGPGDPRERIPADERARFDELLAEARFGLQLRDDQVGVAWNWPAGLLRRALLEAGRRLVERDALHDAAHVLDVDLSELGTLLVSGSGPTADELATRWGWRFVVEAAGPPDTLGPSSGPPPFELFPAPLARAARAVMAMIGAMEGTPGAAPLAGTGVGTVPYRGRARVVTDPADALATLEPGDVVITTITGPAWNGLLPVVGALVVEEGGPLSHAAIIARELGIPAVIGATGATTSIPDDAVVEVDPTTGSVRLV